MPRTNYRQFRFSDSELSSYQALAEKANLPLAVWVRDNLNAIVRGNDYINALKDTYPEVIKASKPTILLSTRGYRESSNDPLGIDAGMDRSPDVFTVPAPRPFPLKRELSRSELHCPVRGCSLGSNHNGPCIPLHPDEETPEIREQNLIVLSRDDPEGFRNRIRELLKLAGQ